MATFLSSLVVAAALLQAPDSTDGRAQLALGRAYLERLATSRALGGAQDSASVHRMLDTADQAFTRAIRAFGAPGSDAPGDTARVLRVRLWSERARFAWERGGLALGPDSWGPLPTDLRLSPVLEELGENLLRACPPGGVLLTAGDADSYAVWYERFVRGLRPDVLVVPLSVWRSDSAFRVRAARDLRLGRRGAGGEWLRALVERRLVCVSMAFAHPPETAGATWRVRPLVWVAGPHVRGDPVSPRDFVFAALKMALDDHDPWAEPAVALYGRAARETPPLCAALATFLVSGEIAECRR
jgi:hypothetical protein